MPFQGSTRRSGQAAAQTPVSLLFSYLKAAWPFSMVLLWSLGLFAFDLGVTMADGTATATISRCEQSKGRMSSGDDLNCDYGFRVDGVLYAGNGPWYLATLPAGSNVGRTAPVYYFRIRPSINSLIKFSDLSIMWLMGVVFASLGIFVVGTISRSRRASKIDESSAVRD